MTQGSPRDERSRFMASVRARFPGFKDAVLADAKITARHRGERHTFTSGGDAVGQVLRLMWVSDAFAALVLYRLKARMQARGIPVLPRLAHRAAMAIAQVSIGDPVIVRPGVYVIHGQVVLDGLVEVGSGTVIGPWVTLGLRAGNVQGPKVGENVQIGTGAKLIGPIEVGSGATIGANAVVVDDVPAGVTVVGAPARPVGEPSRR
jgi:serine O-acetyltransferase